MFCGVTYNVFRVTNNALCSDIQCFINDMQCFQNDIQCFESEKQCFLEWHTML